ncbi:MAG: Stringent starvation protein B [Hyphomicrobiales bacterium]|nr:Stringent starvation protein B [Hyphomicrobiales bacterium]
MAEDHIRYDILAQDALRGVVRKVLSEVARTSLPGEHHFFVTFATHAPGVRVSSRLLEQYPEDMTIVIQHQYWDLAVTEHAFDIGLSFDGIPERLHVPFTAVKMFVDPSVRFSLQFEIATQPGALPGESPRVIEEAEDSDAGARPEEVESTPPSPLPVPVPESGDAPEPVSEADSPRSADERLAVETTTAEEDGDEEPPHVGDAQVVSLDAFRKKN